MNIMTITLHCTDNCGSTLQAMALQKYLIGKGHDVEIIDYRPAYLQYNGSFLKTQIKRLLLWKTSRNQQKKNEAFQKKNLIVTPQTYTNYEELKKCPPKADLYITGSDQIWNPAYQCGRDPAYYLDFVQDTNKKVSYAASVGKSNVSDEEKKLIIDFVKNFYAISVREESTRKFLSKNVSCKVDYVCDPVFLLDKKFYSAIAQKPKSGEKYILVYLVQPSELLDELVEKLKEKYKAKVILIYGLRKNCKCDKHIIDVSPDEFLGYIAGAEFIVASSFHATAFAHIFEKPFAIIPPKANVARIAQMLEVSGLSQRMVLKKEDISRVMEPIDYSEPRRRVDYFITKSKRILDGYC